MTLTDLFDLSLVARADEPGLEVETPSGPATFTFGELDRRANQTARVLAGLGLTQGDRLAVHLANGLGFLDLFLGALRLGVIFVPINILYKEREIAHIVADAAPSLVVATAATAPLFPPDTRILLDTEVAVRASHADPTPIRTPLDGDAPAGIIYTSGTTGRSKGAVLSHNNFLANTASIVTCWQITSRDRYLAVLPLFHVHGLANGVCAWLATGCRMYLAERFDYQRAAALFSAFEPTLFFGVPTVYVRLLDLPLETARRIGAAMRLFVSGSAPLPASVFDAFRERYGHAILERYGMSETLMLISNPYAGERRPGTVGLPLPGITVRIVNATDVPVSTEEVGQLHVRGPNVFLGYWSNTDATRSAFTDGWFRTGDLAMQSADGYVTLCGRASDLIISGGFNIYPREIEDLLLECPGVKEVAVVGAPDVRRGEVPVAYVVADASWNAAQAEALCTRSLASFKVPRAFIAIDVLPRNALGKVQKHLLPSASGSAT